MDVAGRHAPNAEPLGQPREPAIARPVVTPERPLQLDQEAIAPEGLDQAPPERLGSSRLAGCRAPARPLEWRGKRAVASAAGEADQPLGVALERGEREDGGEWIAVGFGSRTRMR